VTKQYCKDCKFAKNEYFFFELFDSRCRHPDNLTTEIDETHAIGFIKEQSWGCGFNHCFDCDRFKPRTWFQKLFDFI